MAKINIDIQCDITCTDKKYRLFNINALPIASLYQDELLLQLPYKKILVVLHTQLLDKQNMPTPELKELTPQERKQRRENGTYYYHNQVEDLASVVAIHRRFDFEYYFQLNNNNKKHLILDELHTGILQAAKQYGWNTAMLNTTYQQCLDANLQNHFAAKHLGEKTSPNRQYKACVWVEFDLTEIRLYLRVTEKTGKLVTNQHFYTLNGLDETIMYPDDIMPILQGKIVWQGSQVTVTDKKGNEVTKVTVKDLPKIAVNV